MSKGNENRIKCRAELEAEMESFKADVPNMKRDEFIRNINAKDNSLDLPICQNPDDDGLYEELAEEKEGSTGMFLDAPLV